MDPIPAVGNRAAHQADRGVDLGINSVPVGAGGAEWKILLFRCPPRHFAIKARPIISKKERVFPSATDVGAATDVIIQDIRARAVNPRVRLRRRDRHP
jgi:hypothetical protein